MRKPLPKPAFGAGVLAGLRSTAGAGGEPFYLVLDQIEEDPHQPRTTFDPAELEQLAETIRLYGVLSPVGVRKLDGGRYRLVYGARRVRAARLAGHTRIPVTVLADDKTGLEVQVIENQARANLSNQDLARVVNRMFDDGVKVKQIAAICHLKEYQVAAYRSAERLPPFLAARMDHADMRALYDLFRVWEKHGPALEAAMPDTETYLTITEARRVIETATGKTSSSIFLARSSEAERPPRTLDGAPRRDAVTQTRYPRFVMRTADGRQGILVTNRRASRPDHVHLDLGADGVLEALFADLQPVGVA